LCVSRGLVTVGKGQKIHTDQRMVACVQGGTEKKYNSTMVEQIFSKMLNICSIVFSFSQRTQLPVSSRQSFCALRHWSTDSAEINTLSSDMLE